MPPLSDDTPPSRRADDGDSPLRSDFIRLSQVVEKLTATLESMPDKMERIYLRQDIYRAEQQAHMKDHDGISKNLGTLNTIVKVVAQVVGSAILLGLLGLLFMQGR